MTEVCILLFSNIERGLGLQEAVFVGFGHDLMFLGIFQHHLSKVVGLCQESIKLRDLIRDTGLIPKGILLKIFLDSMYLVSRE